MRYRARMVKHQRVLGIDPGTRKLGFAVVEKQGNRLLPLAHGVVDVSKLETLDLRLLQIAKEINAVIDEFAPTEAAMETVFRGRNVKTALTAAEGRGAVRLVLAQRELPLSEYAPTEIKRAVVGRGAADKIQVAFMVKTLLSLDSTPKPDAADALAIAITHLHR